MATLKEIIEYSKSNPESDYAKRAYDLLVKGDFDEQAKAEKIDLAPFGRQTYQKPDTVISRIKSKVQEAKGKMQSSISESQNLYDTGQQTQLETVGQRAAASFKGVADVVTSPIGAVLEEGYEKLRPEYREDIEKNLTKVGEYIAPVVQYTAEEYAKLSPREKANLKALGNVVSVGVDAASAGIGGKAVKSVGGKVVESIPDLGVKKGIKKVSESIKPTVTPEMAAGQIIQGTTDDVAPAIKALKNIDTSNVKSYEDLAKKFDEVIPQISKQVDEELLKDNVPKTLEELATVQSTKAGNKISTDYVTRGIKQLSELYSKIGDDVAAAEMVDLLNVAKTTGLTTKEVNDIARLYGQEFSSKAFSKLGDPLTSVNAQAFETTRKGLKEVARSGMSGDVAKQLDSELSSIYNTKTLIDKNVEAVNKLKQKIQERGLFEKVGHLLTKTADLASGGLIRGLVGGLLPRGVGNKVMNALDLESALKSNLQIIEKALKEKTDAGLIKSLNQSSKELSKRSTASLTMNKTVTPNNTQPNISNIDNTIPPPTKKASGGVDNFSFIPPVPTPDENGNFELTPESIAFSFLGSLGLKGLQKTKVKDISKMVDKDMIVPLKTYVDNPTAANLIQARIVGQKLGLADKFIIDKSNFKKFVNQIIDYKDKVMANVPKMLEGKEKANLIKRFEQAGVKLDKN